MAGVVDAVAGDDGFRVAGLDVNGYMSGRMAWGGFEPDFVGDLVVGFDEGVKSGVDDGLDGLFANVIRHFVFEILEMIPFDAPEEIGRAGECWRPSVVF